MQTPYNDPPRVDFLALVTGEEQRQCIGGTDEQLLRSEEKAQTHSYRNEEGFLRLFRFRGTLFSNSWRSVLAVLIVSTVLTLTHELIEEWVDFHDKPHTLAITPIGFLLVFRSNLSYSRWWEGRNIIAQMVQSVKCIALKSLTYCTAEHPSAVLRHGEAVMRLALALVIAIRHDVQLRTSGESELHPTSKEGLAKLRLWELGHYITAEQIKEVKAGTGFDVDRGQGLGRPPGIPPPMIIARLLMAQVVSPATEGHPLGTSYRWSTAVDDISRHIDELIASWQGMMKIVNTPMPFPYAHSLEVFLNVWIFTVPLVMLDPAVDMGWFTIPISGILAVLLFGINNVGSEIEDPFGNDINDFDLIRFQIELHREMDAILRMQYRSQKDQAGEAPELFIHQDSSQEELYGRQVGTHAGRG
eukprot:TRINITY_DN11110_c0_g1_i1.p1 TRINITY_DN11110_c0_g1~~TRINITY_DN11110_c0_g1_i1.p1  ORF type:complete len:415 (+),score=103.29 TRINITY_DN11110_c0_g1_i1:122-1366(+)